MQVTDLIVPLAHPAAVSLAAGNDAGVAGGGSEEGEGGEKSEPKRTPAAKREPKQNIKSQPSVFDVLPKKSPRRL
jgi:hypothetical protein